MINRKNAEKIYKFLEKMIESTIHVVEIIFLIDFRFIKNPINNRRNNSLLLLGNGPSLKNDIDEIIKLHNGTQFDALCVNNFASSVYYEEIQPSYYVIVDPSFFEEDLNNRWVKEKKRSIISNIVQKTNWMLSLYIPRYYRNSQFIREISKNDKVKIIPINNIPMEGGIDRIKELFFDWNLGNPVWRNVIVAALHIAIKMKFDKILLFGVDHSWFENIKVKEDNKIVLGEKYFDSTKNKNRVLKDAYGFQRKLHEYLFQWASAFREYHVLSKYAERKGIKIINCTKNSYIDAFERTNISFD